MNPKRIQRKRTKGWKMPPNTIYVGRGSKWGNPFKVIKKRTGGFLVKRVGVGRKRRTQKVIERLFGWETYAVDCSIELYREQIVPHIHPLSLRELKGKNLACWCSLDVPCHADVLLEVANR